MISHTPSYAGRPTLVHTTLLGIAQILLWGGSFFLMAVLAPAVIADTGWAAARVYGSLSLSIVISGLLAPAVGRWIARDHGPLLLLGSGAVVGLGLIGLSLAGSLAQFTLGWCLIGVGMALGLYDALFATLGKRYGAQARSPIVRVTLIGGLCTTVTWPVVSALIEAFGWRDACRFYGIALCLLIWPLNAAGFVSARAGGAPPEPDRGSQAQPPAGTLPPGIYWLLALSFTLGASIMTAVSVLLLDLLRARGLSPALALSIASVMGPCQIGIRAVEALYPRKHPIWSALISAVLTSVGLGLVLIDPALAFGGVILYSLGNGLRTIVKGTLPLALVSAAHYPRLLGRLALPSLIAQGLTPLAGALAMQAYGPGAVFAALCGFSILNTLITIAIKRRINL
ncbi:MAG TPA: hypothetical protein VD886_03505 [Herpetosiphonaceae bacterium]|nr:hypothetical protein [Herpetosiphonaceae bacterium]